MGGFILATVVILSEIISLYACTSNIACLGLNLILLSPGLFVSNITKAGANVTINLFGNILFYFIIGGLIGLLLASKKKKK